jgi:uncharacterized membrane protein YbaN (DUF454 family)
MRMMWTAAGCVAFTLGFIGAFLPLLPTVPLMLLAAFCFARGSERFHDWLVNRSRFGPSIRDWQDRGAIRPRAKLAAMVAIVASFGISLWLAVPHYVLVIQGFVLAAVSLFILTRPHGMPVPMGDDPAGSALAANDLRRDA